MHRLARLVPAATLALGGLIALTGPAGLTAPATAAFAIPVDCSDGATISGDDRTYELKGPCGVVVITASNATVDVPASTKLVVRGDHNTVTARPAQRVGVYGDHQDLRLTSTKRLRVASPGSRIHFEGLVEHARVPGDRARVAARQITELAVGGNRNEVTARRGYDARVGGDHNTLTWKRLDRLVVPGDDNDLDVHRGSTDTTVTGAGNDLDLNHAV